MKKALAIILVVFLLVIAYFAFWPEKTEEPMEEVSETKTIEIVADEDPEVIEELVEEEEIIEEVEEIEVVEELELMAGAIPEEYMEEESEEVYEETYVEPETNEDGWIYLGTFEMTAYEWTGYTCANGNYPTEGYTVACNSLPLGTRVYIDGVGYRTVEDRGASWHADNWMDLYLGDVSACMQWGIRYVSVWIVE